MTSTPALHVTHFHRRRLIGGALALAGALVLTGCGKRGPLEPPPEDNPSKTAAADTTKQQSSELPVAVGPQSPRGRRRPPPIKAPDTPFLLDFLL